MKCIVSHELRAKPGDRFVWNPEVGSLNQVHVCAGKENPAPTTVSIRVVDAPTDDIHAYMNETVRNTEGLYIVVQQRPQPSLAEALAGFVKQVGELILQHQFLMQEHQRLREKLAATEEQLQDLRHP